MKNVVKLNGFARIGLLRWQKDRLMGYRAHHREWIHLTPQVGTAGECKLTLNMVTEPGGQVRVGLLGKDDQKAIPGYGLDDSEIIEGDHRAVEVRWKGKSTLPAYDSNHPVMAKIEITRGTLWAFDFVT
jgi:hypothetical protein